MMMRFFYLLFLFLSTVFLLTSYSFEKKENIGVVLSKGISSDTLLLGQTTIEDVLKKYGKAKIETFIWKVSGKFSRSLYCKRQELDYNGLVFIFENNLPKSKKASEKDTCLLDEIIVNASSNYCINNICTGMTKEEVESEIGTGIYGIVNGVTDSLNNVYYSSMQMRVCYKKLDDKIKVEQVHIEDPQSGISFESLRK